MRVALAFLATWLALLVLSSVHAEAGGLRVHNTKTGPRLCLCGR